MNGRIVPAWGTVTAPTSTREARRLETRARLFDAALAEISSRGLAAADVSAIAAAAGVVRGTFYFHFPSKEHVLVELERNEEIRMVAELGTAGGDLVTVLTGSGLADTDIEAVGSVLERHMHDRHPGSELVVYRTGHRGDVLLIGVE